MSFYLTYRPQIINEIDNAAVRAQLLSLLTKNKKNLPHAYFFNGPKGAGKTTTARLIAKLFLCENPGKSGPCGTCPACTSIADGSHIDVLEIDAASNRGIDDVRELRDRIKLSPAIGAYKIFIIDEVHMMTTEAFNALLKTLEEPPKHAVFILATTDPQKVPATVRSRCLEISFAKAKHEELLSALLRIVKKEKMDISEDAVRAIVETADGAFRDAVKLLEQASFIEGTITAGKVMRIIQKSDEPKREEFLTSILVEKNSRKALDAIEAFTRDGADMKTLLTDCLRDLQHELLVQIQDDPKQDKKLWKRNDVQDLMKYLMKAFEDIRFSPIPQLPIELAVLEYLDEQNKESSPGLKNSSTLPVVIPSRQQAERNPVIISNSQRDPSQKPRDDGMNNPVIVRNPAPHPVILSEAKNPLNNTTSQRDPSPPKVDQDDKTDVPPFDSDHLNLEKLTSHWPDFIEALKPYNHSVAGVIRGARAKSVENGIVTIEAFYKFHQERLSDPRVRDILATVLKKLFGVKVRVEIVLGKK